MVSDSEAGHGNDCAFERSSVASGRGDLGGSFAAAERFRVSAASAVRWAQLHSQTGGVGPRPRGGKSRSPLEPHAAWVLDLTTAEPDLTLEAIVQRLLAGLGLKTSEAAVHDATARFPSASTSVTTSVGPLSSNIHGSISSR